MKNLSIILILFMNSILSAQILCIECFDNSNEIINPSSTNLIQNGSFEVNTVNVGDYICPLSTGYMGNLNFWICTGGGRGTYASLSDSIFISKTAHGQNALYLGNSFTQQICADTTINCLKDSGCMITGLDTSLFPILDPFYGNRDGVSIEQSVSGLVPGANYIVEFWAGGEDVPTMFFPYRGIFAVDIGFGKIILPCTHTIAAFPYKGIRYAILFKAVSNTHIVKFTNWGHICDSCTEVVLDDVRLYEQSTAENSLNCSSNYNVKIVKDTFICPGDSVFFNHQYYADSGIYTDINIISDTTFTNILHIQYIDCTNYDPIIKVPNAFSPNGDSHNDLFVVYGRNIDEYHIKIFDRWGVIVYQSDNVNELNISGWDGKYKGNYADIGTYTYLIETKNNQLNKFKISKGNLSILK